MKNTMFRKSCAGIAQDHVQVAVDVKINLSRFPAFPLINNLVLIK